MNDHESKSGSTVKREFYAPATFQFATTPGRIERTLGRLFRERGAMEGRPRAVTGMREFYAPATFQFAVTPGRVERLVGGLLRQRGAMAGYPRTTVEGREFYAPATFQFATGPGRIERLVAGTLRERGTTDGRRRADGSEHATPASARPGARSLDAADVPRRADTGTATSSFGIDTHGTAPPYRRYPTEEGPPSY